MGGRELAQAAGEIVLHKLTLELGEAVIEVVLSEKVAHNFPGVIYPVSSCGVFRSWKNDSSVTGYQTSPSPSRFPPRDRVVSNHLTAV